MPDIKRSITPRLSFSGHETFQCRHLWLKKGYDYVMDTPRRSFTDEDAVVRLGVGKNMVNSIRFWMKAFGLLNEDESPNQLAHRLLSDGGWDPYIEDQGTLWLLHHRLVTNGYSSIYNLVFNELRRDRIEFTKHNFLSFVKRKAEVLQTSVNEGTVLNDFGVFTKMYLRTVSQSKDREEGSIGILTDLNLIETESRRISGQEKIETEEYFSIQNTERNDLPNDILLYAILANADEADISFDRSVSFNTLLTSMNQVGSVFALNATGLYRKLEAVASTDRNVVFSDQAGIRELSFKERPSALSILTRYYES
ncbi:Protein of unknown function [Siphonobacter aquaeclarae]|uniref:DUF4007 domain-containing protein n=2 Tax=Siphonobacter aquaeclarae TaxID=563176 RepID=A0A1G9MWY5_9BACT|nr:Protein of unknown function [Siphonobacter aquaeclarae]